MGKKIKVTEQYDALQQNPFDQLDFSGLELKELPVNKPQEAPLVKKEAKKGRVDVKRVVGGRAGKEVTLIMGLPEQDLKDYLKRFQKLWGIGGAVKEDQLELQGDQREKVKSLLDLEGFKVVAHR